MAKTSVINPRRRRRAKTSHKKGARVKRRRRNYGSAAVARSANKRRRSHGKRRRNPGVPSVYGGGGYRQKNPFGLERVMDTLPAATAGVWAARWAVKMAGPMDAEGPGIKHALAIWLASQFGSGLIGSTFGSSAKSEYARIAALGFGGDLFMRKRFLKDNAFVKENLYLDGVDSDDVPNYSDGADLNGFQNQSALGDSFTDAAGNTYVQTEQGWALAGMGETFVGPDGTVYALEGGVGTESFQYPANYDRLMQSSGVGVGPDPAYGRTGSAFAGFQNQSALGMRRANPSASSSFGYA